MIGKAAEEIMSQSKMGWIDSVRIFRFRMEVIMISGRHITKIISGIMAAAVLACILAMLFPQRLAEALGGSTLAMRYQQEMFDTDNILQIDILMEETDWKEMLENASSEEYYSCDVVINGQQLNNVGIRPKGNTSLSAFVQDPDSDRFSLKLEFDHYVEGQTCLGLDKLILNNNYADATNMKEAVIYDMYQYLGADASLYNYAEISVNGEYWGVYLALEAVEDSFLLRNYGAEDGELYKPESMGGGGSFDAADFGFRGRGAQERESGSEGVEEGGFFPGNEMLDGKEGSFEEFPFGEWMPGSGGVPAGEGTPGNTDNANRGNAEPSGREDRGGFEPFGGKNMPGSRV